MNKPAPPTAVQPQSTDPIAAAPAVELAPQRAVQEYLNALLQEATTQARVEDAVTVAVKTEVAVTEVTIDRLVEVPVATPVSEPVIERVEPQAVVETEVEEAPEPSVEARAWIDGRPAWAQQRFECLLFKVAGLTLAVPLVELGGVLEVKQPLRPLFGQPDWFLGLLPSKTAGTVKTLDTARWVMQDKCPEDAADGFKYVILMEGSDWGMACHKVEDAITLEPHQVRWRSDRGRRPWLAGTVIEHMCAIMDVSALHRLLDDTNAGRSDNQ